LGVVVQLFFEKANCYRRKEGVMKGPTQSKTTSRVGLCRLTKYALLSIMVIFGFNSKITTSIEAAEPNEVKKYLYTASQLEISRINKDTLEREVLTGNLLEPGSPDDSPPPIIEFPTNLIIEGNYMYFSGNGVRIQRLFIGVDGKSAIETIVPQAGLLSGQGVNFKSMAVNDTQVFWVLTDTPSSYIHGKKLGNNDLPEVLISVFDTARLRATSTALFIATCCYDSGTPSIFKYNLGTKTLDLIQSDVDPDRYLEIPTALSATEYFWVNGNTIYRMPQSSTTPQVLVTGLPDIVHITADEYTLYALEGGLTDTNTIHKIDLATGSTTPLVTADDIRDILVYEETLYWISALGLYTRNPAGTITELYVNDGSEIILGGAGGTEMVGVAGKVAVFAGVSWTQILFHDLSRSSTNILTLIDIDFMDANSDSVFYGGFNQGIGNIPPDLNLRLPETLKDGLVSIDSKIYLQNGWLYWSEYSNFWDVYRISRMRVDGSQYQVLFNEIHRGLVLYNNRLYFMCESGCSLPSWTLVSIPLDGGTPVSEFALWGGPAQMIQKDGIFYIADTPDGGSSMSIYAIDLELNDYCELFSGLPYRDIEIEVSSSAWIYRLQDSPGQNEKLIKNSINGCIVGEDILIDPDPPGTNLFVNTFHSDDNSVYYWLWTKGLKRDSSPSPPELLIDARLIPWIFDITSGEMGKKKTMSMPQLLLLLGD
jgi:hypothetical protein